MASGASDHASEKSGNCAPPCAICRGVSHGAESQGGRQGVGACRMPLVASKWTCMPLSAWIVSLSPCKPRPAPSLAAASFAAVSSEDGHCPICFQGGFWKADLVASLRPCAWLATRRCT